MFNDELLGLFQSRAMIHVNERILFFIKDLESTSTEVEFFRVSDISLLKNALIYQSILSINDCFIVF